MTKITRDQLRLFFIDWKDTPDTFVKFANGCLADAGIDARFENVETEDDSYGFALLVGDQELPDEKTLEEWME